MSESSSSLHCFSAPISIPFKDSGVHLIHTLVDIYLVISGTCQTCKGVLLVGIGMLYFNAP